MGDREILPRSFRASGPEGSRAASGSWSTCGRRNKAILGDRATVCTIADGIGDDPISGRGGWGAAARAAAVAGAAGQRQREGGRGGGGHARRVARMAPAERSAVPSAPVLRCIAGDFLGPVADRAARAPVDLRDGRAVVNPLARRRCGRVGLGGATDEDWYLQVRHRRPWRRGLGLQPRLELGRGGGADEVRRRRRNRHDLQRSAGRRAAEAARARFREADRATINVVAVPFSDIYNKLLTASHRHQRIDGTSSIPSGWATSRARLPGGPDRSRQGRQGLQWDDIAPFFRDFSASYGGKTYAIPLDGDFQMAYYRKDLLERGGVAAQDLGRLPRRSPRIPTART